MVILPQDLQLYANQLLGTVYKNPDGSLKIVCKVEVIGSCRINVKFRALTEYETKKHSAQIPSPIPALITSAA